MWSSIRITSSPHWNYLLLCSHHIVCTLKSDDGTIHQNVLVLFLPSQALLLYKLSCWLSKHRKQKENNKNDQNVFLMSEKVRPNLQAAVVRAALQTLQYPGKPHSKQFLPADVRQFYSAILLSGHTYCMPWKYCSISLESHCTALCVCLCLSECW